MEPSGQKSGETQFFFPENHTLILYQLGSFHCTIDIETKCKQVFQAFWQDAISMIKRFPYRKMSLFLL